MSSVFVGEDSPQKNIATCGVCGVQLTLTLTYSSTRDEVTAAFEAKGWQAFSPGWRCPEHSNVKGTVYEQEQIVGYAQ